MINFLNSVYSIFTDNWTLFLEGVGYTMLIALTGTVLGLLIGLITGVVRTIPQPKNCILKAFLKAVNAIISVYVEVFRGTPMMVQSMVIYWGYAFMIGNGKTLPLIPAGIFIVSINTGAYMTEIVRGGIISIDKGQFEGAYSIGMTHFQTMARVVIPQTIRNILPAISNEFVINIKDTSVLNVITVTELFFYTAKIAKSSYAIFQTYTIACVIYFILTFTVTRILLLMERLLEGKDTYELAEETEVD